VAGRNKADSRPAVSPIDERWWHGNFRGKVGRWWKRVRDLAQPSEASKIVDDFTRIVD
jgi:hypothetical protein